MGLDIALDVFASQTFDNRTGVYFACSGVRGSKICIRCYRTVMLDGLSTAYEETVKLGARG